MKKIGLTVILLSLLHGFALAGAVRDHHVVAELVPEMDAIVPGETLTLCFNIKHDPEWHTYWKNPGLAGVPTQLKWDLPEGFEAGPIQWARPQRVKMAIYNTFGYEGEVTLLIDIKTPPSLKPGSEVTLRASSVWMMCAKTCYPSTAKFSVSVPVAETARPHARGKQLAEATRATMPVENQLWSTSATLAEDSATLLLTRRDGASPDKRADPQPEDLYFFSDDGLIDSHPEQTITREGPGSYKLVLPRAEFGPKDPRALTGVLLCKSGPEPNALLIRADFPPPTTP